MDIADRVVEALQYLLNQRGMMQKSIAKKIGVSPVTISDVVNRNQAPGAKVIINLLQEFPEFSTDYIIRGQGELIVRKTEGDHVQDPKVAYLKYYNLPDLVNKVIELEKKLSEMSRLYQELKNDMK